MVDKLITWITACWYCETCTWFMLLASVVSCIVRALITIAILYAVARFGVGVVNEVANTAGFSAFGG